MPQICFLPGAGGSPEFWKPVAARLPGSWKKEYFGWPGLGDQAHDPRISGIDDLVSLVTARMDRPTNIVAQSMGSVIAARIAVSRPDLVRRLVLVATSGGIDMARFGAADWRPDYRELFPKAAKWIFERQAAASVPVERILAPTLLIWGGADEISPVSVGRHLEERIPNAVLHIVRGGRHDVARKDAELVAELIGEHLADTTGK